MILLALNPDNPDAYLRKGRCLRGLSKYNESIECFDLTIKYDKNNISALNYKGFSLKSLSKNNESEELFREALNLNMNPSDADGYSNKGLSLHGLKEYDESLKFYKKSTFFKIRAPISW